uniref:Uncharacterized protein n=1 Tax=Craspedostauros australis TaxID=1486917 RepID=A0A7R9WNB6_9STRA|mmetsp:Transcript_12962/g.35781  ORF Transcript_12962/g.35781 Transcript_12962/m.35781 type:complete len:240 (+) Transcript_12962:183-902(+)|eukprot:CAMPEP_0198136356 /NCGR_PEP_ID=MMETSP1442-20131203/61069_1 /TAXON_ID= /ORGANISM="Craspedostauros australis, Strain CCMP3328" /LENGTH=239 /DNA_ID=CAMNT_0043797569 /DNA_START=637 /DNA_END=1356 /DNA_ORIENTATION=+
MAAFTIDHGHKHSEGSDLLLSFHDNDHYNSVRLSGSTPSGHSSTVASKADVKRNDASSKRRDDDSTMKKQTQRQEGGGGGATDQEAGTESLSDTDAFDAGDDYSGTGATSTSLHSRSDGKGGSEVPTQSNSGAECKQSDDLARGRTSANPQGRPKLGSGMLGDRSAIRVKMRVTKKGPCPCGSGQQYKKCCLVREKANKRKEKIKATASSSSAAAEDSDYDPNGDEASEMKGNFRVLEI